MTTYSKPAALAAGYGGEAVLAEDPYKMFAGVMSSPGQLNGRAIPIPVGATYIGSNKYAFDVARNLPKTLDVPYGHFGELGELLDTLEDFVRAGEKLDRLKKLYFYGKGAEAEDPISATSTTVQDGLTRAQISGDLFHGIIGLATEASELVEALRKPLANRGVYMDYVNLEEEIGDNLWYTQTIATAIGTTLDRSAVANTAKLKRRYPHNFTEDAAINRDVAAEREVLESHRAAHPEISEMWAGGQESSPELDAEPDPDPRLEVYGSGSELDA